MTQKGRHFSFFLVLFARTSAQAGTFKVPDVPEGEVRIYRVYYSDPEIDKGEQTGMQALMRQWSPQSFRVEAEWQGEGEARHLVYRRSEALFSGAGSEWTFEFAPGKDLALESFERRVNSPEGKLLFREAYGLNEPSSGYPENLFHAWVLEFAFRGLEFAPGKTFSLWAWSSPLIIYKMELRVVGKETLELPIGPRECWKLEMETTPDNFVGFSGAIMKRLSPTFTFWIMADESRVMVRQQGPAGLLEGIRPPKQIQELVYIRSPRFPEGIGKKPGTRPGKPFPALVSGPPFRMPEVPQGEMRLFRVSLETPVEDLESLPYNQKLMYRGSPATIEKLARWTGEGDNRRLEYIRTEKLNDRCTAVTRFSYRPGRELRLKDMRRTHTAPSGKVVREEYFSLDDPFFNYPACLCHSYTMELAYRGMELVPGNSREFHLFMGPGVTLKMLIQVDGIETLTLGDGRTIPCFRLEMYPDIEEYIGVLGKLVQPIVPRYTWWLEQGGTHAMVRYRGPMGQVNVINAPVEVHELIEAGQ